MDSEIEKLQEMGEVGGLGIFVRNAERHYYVNTVGNIIYNLLSVFVELMFFTARGNEMRY